MLDCTAKECKTLEIKIYLSGPIDVIEQTCRKYCLEVGLCVTVTPTKYVYTGGEELGAVVGLLQYPRFPDECVHLKAFELAYLLLEDTAQHSILLVETGGCSRWITRKDYEDRK